MKKKKIVSLILATTVICGGIASASPINEAKLNESYVKGYDGNLIKPDGEITRAEAVALYVRLATGGYEIPEAKDSGFSDIEKNAWYKKDVDYAAEKGVIKGYPDGTFKPEGKITRAEFSSMLSALEKDSDKKSDFPDVNDQHWAKAAIDKLYANGVIKGYPDGEFKPDNNITRSESVRVFNTVHERNVIKDSLSELENPEDIRVFEDLEKDHWAYYELVGAANSYQYERKDNVVSWKKVVSEELVTKVKKYMVSEEDAMKELGLETKPESVMVTGWVDTLTVVDSAANIVGIPDDHHLDESLHDKYPLISGEDGNINYELIKEKKPTNIYISKETLESEKNKDLKEFIENNKIVPFYREIKSVEDVFKNIGLIASAFGTEDMAKSNLVNLFSRVGNIEKLSKSNGNPNVALLTMTKDGLSIASKDSYAAQILELGGFKNTGDKIAGESDQFGFVKTDLDNVMKQKPDSIVIMVRTDKATRNEDEKKFYEDLIKEYPDSSVVKNKTYGRIDHHSILPKSSMLVIGLESVSNIANKSEEEISEKLKDGVYNGVGTGFAGGLKTKVEVKDGKIEKIDVTESNETSNILAKAKDTVIKAIIDKQSVEVDTVSGATRSSEGIMKSVANALSKAK